MKTYEEAIQEAVRVRRGPDFSSARDVFGYSAYALLSYIYDKTQLTVCNDIRELEEKQVAEERVARKKAAREDQLAQQRANLARKGVPQ